MWKREWSLVKFIWISLSFLVLVVTLLKFDKSPQNDIEIFQIYSMAALTFPTGVLFILFTSGLLAVLEKYFSTQVSTSYSYLLFVWIGFFISGYFQWFLLFPYLLTNLRSYIQRRRNI
jgi:hypothetical protein